MKRILLRCFSVLVVMALLTGMLSIVSYASDNELVLTKIGHTMSDTISLTNAATRSVSLTVPFSYSGNTLDLSSGLILEKTSSIDCVVTSFPSGSAAAIGEAGTAGPPVSMLVTYYKGGNTVIQHSTVYSVSVLRAARKNLSLREQSQSR
jgi:hypothetical protein